MIENKSKIELRHEAIQELLGVPPGWLTRWGITVFFCVIVALLIGCYFFQYPDTITASTTITTEQPVTWIVAKGSGNIDSIYVTDNTKVKKNQIIAVLQSAADYRDIESVKQYINKITVSMNEVGDRILIGNVPIKDLQLGELQSDFFQLMKALRDYNVFCKEQVAQKKVEALEYELNELKNYLNYTEQQVNIQKQNLKFAYNQLRRDSMMYAKQMMSDAEFERAQQQLLSSRLQLNQSFLSMNNSEINIAKIEQSIRECRSQHNDELSIYVTNMQGAIDKINSSIELWEQTYLFRSSIDGVISFSNYWSKNQFVNQGEKVFAIIAEKPGEMIGKCILPINGAGKVKVGQNVNIKLDGYPYMEYGILLGKVKNVSLIPIDVVTSEGTQRFITAEISLGDRLVTTYRKELPFTGEMLGTSEILTKEMSLLEHFINPLKYLWNTHFSN